MAETAVTLPHGIWREGELRRDAVIRDLGAADEAALAEGPWQSPAARTTALLARCVISVGGVPAGTDDVRELTAGDREALILELRRLTLGESLECLVPCAGCSEPITVELDIGDLLVPPYDRPAARHELTVGDNGTAYGLRLRLPRGSDQEAAAELAANDLDGAIELVLRRCVEELAGPAHPPAGLAELIGDRMGELDPQAEVVLELACPACEQTFAVLLDAADFFFRELALRHGQIFQEVHELASCYGWGEAEILALPENRRHRYLAFVRDEQRMVAR